LKQREIDSPGRELFNTEQGTENREQGITGYFRSEIISVDEFISYLRSSYQASGRALWCAMASDGVQSSKIGEGKRSMALLRIWALLLLRTGFVPVAGRTEAIG
jgi:hypothetical protein